jgi:hypothetical protein
MKLMNPGRGYSRLQENNEHLSDFSYFNMTEGTVPLHEEPEPSVPG